MEQKRVENDRRNIYKRKKRKVCESKLVTALLVEHSCLLALHSCCSSLLQKGCKIKAKAQAAGTVAVESLNNLRLARIRYHFGSRLVYRQSHHVRYPCLAPSRFRRHSH